MDVYFQLKPFKGLELHVASGAFSGQQVFVSGTVQEAACQRDPSLKLLEKDWQFLETCR
jgi:hypothetical protein